ncbi:MAG: hypothetical protein IPJ48_17375 [Propionivibrio sp.]|uniref:Uncharacterized protein n=1 Tax=Candidatus Propionivibrio dominans TaxID=2954373 RepID=A0A9D7FE48_9RHOO|nr:hypothetical protein [Candidatus Propionivibrio dominans]
MTLLDEITAKCSPALIASRDFDAIAAAVSIGRTKPSAREIGNGTILEVLGLTVGNALLDVINTVPDFATSSRWWNRGRLTVGSALVQATVQSLVPMGVLTQPQSDALCALGFDPDPVTAQQVSDELGKA